MKKIIIVLLTILLLFLCACEVQPPEDNVPPVTEDIEDTEVTTYYTVTFDLGTKKETQQVKEGEFPVPPTVEDADFGTVLRRHTGWDKEILPAMEDTTYKATYETVQKICTATFILPDQTIEIPFNAGTAPIPPEVPDYHGATFALWDKEIELSNESVTFTALYTTIAGTTPMSRILMTSSLSLI